VSKKKRAKPPRPAQRRESALERAFPTLFQWWARCREFIVRLIPPARENAIAIGIAIILFLRPFVSGKTYERSNGVCQIAIYTLFAMWIARACRQKKLLLKAPLLTACLGIFVLIAGVTFFTSVNSDETYRRFFELLSYFLMFVMAASAVRDTRAVTRIIIVVAVASVLLCGQGFYQGCFGLHQARRIVEQDPDLIQHRITGQFTPDFMDRLRSNRIFSYFLHPNSFAGYLILLIPISICSFVATLSTSRRAPVKKVKKQRKALPPEEHEELPPFSVVAWLVVALFQTGALVWTFSRGAWLSLLVSLFCLAVFVLLRGGRLWRGAAAAACLCAAVLAASQGVGGQEQDVMHQEAVLESDTASSPGLESDLIRGEIPTVRRLVSRATLQMRVTYWQGALGMVRARPLLGVGLGSFGSAYPRFMVLGGYPVQEAHNDPLQVLAETGVLGFTPFAAFWVVFIVFGLRSCSSKGSTSARWLRVGIFFGLVAFLLHSLIDFDFEIPGIALNVFALCGLLVAASEEQAKTVRFGWGKGIIVLTGLAVTTTLALRPHVAEALFNGTGFAAPGIMRAWWTLFWEARLLACVAPIAVVLGVTAKMTGSHPNRSDRAHRISSTLAALAANVTAFLIMAGVVVIWLLTTATIDAHGFGQNYRANQLEAAQKILRGEPVPDLLLVTLFPPRPALEQARKLQDDQAGLVAMTRAKLDQVKGELAVAAHIYPHRALYYVFIGEMDVWLAPFEPNAARHLDSAIANLEKAVELNPWTYYWRMLLGDAYMRRTAFGDGRLYVTKALREFELAAENYPNDPESWMQLGAVLTWAGQRGRADDCFRRAAELRKSARH
jgi:O-antigen ligase